MSLRGEVLDFVNAYTKTADTGTKQKEADDRGKYYETMGKVAQQNADTNQARLALSASRLAGKNATPLAGVPDANNVVVSPAYAPGAPNNAAVNPVDGAAPTQPANWNGNNAAVPMYAQGGAVGDDDSEDGEDNGGNANSQQPAAVGDDDEGGESAAGGGQSFDAGSVMQRWGARAAAGQDNPVAVGLKGIIQEFGLNAPNAAVQDSGNPPHPGRQKLSQNDGAATDEEIKAMNKAVDPKGQLSDSAKTIARLDKGVNYWLSQGDPKKAGQLAKALIMYGKSQSERFGAAAANAVQKGDMQSAVKFLRRAYDNIPDGNDLEASVDPNGNVQATLVQPDGSKQNLGTFDAPQVFKLALGVKDGSEYLQRMAQIASGGRTVANQQPKQAAPMKVGEFNTSVQNVGQEVDDLKLQLDPGTSSAIKNTAVHLFTDPVNRRGGLTPNEAATAAAQIALPDPKNPNTPNFKVAPMRDGSGAMVAFNDGRRLFVPKAQFDQLVAVRAAKLKAMQPKQQPAAAAQPGQQVPLGPTGNDYIDSLYQGMRAGG